MGVVYKAEDITLERSVALKFLADHLLNDTEAKERFLREAKAAAALHHPNICPVYEIAEGNGKTFISMAFLEGESLEDRIAQGPLPIKDALDIARQVAEGLQAAHAKNVVHRDIKPANILVSPEGRPTIMDFGLARLTEASRLTKVDTAMGTVAYMSPEQAQGMDVDSRSDLWALGCVLYEMVSGLRPFKGAYDQALLYEIVHEEPAPLTGIRAGVPMELEFIVGKCLAKDASDRYQSAKEIGVDLRTLAEKLKSGRSTILRTAQMTGAVPAAPGGQTVNPTATLPPDAVVLPKRSLRLLQAAAALFALAFLGLLAFQALNAPQEPERLVRRFSFAPEGLAGGVISPDGRYVVYGSIAGRESTLWIRSLSGESARQLPGTQGARGAFWSPDSSSIGFGTGSQLKRTLVAGGAPTTLCDLPGQSNYFPFSGGTWSPDGERIVFSSGRRLYEVAARGGEPQLLFDQDDNSRNYAPYFLPTDDGSHGLAYVDANAEEGRLAVLDLDSGERRLLVSGYRPVYSPEGYLIYEPWRRGQVGIWALPFSLPSLEATGDPFPLSDSGLAPSVSKEGTLIYRDVPAITSETLAWRDRTGRLIETVGQQQTDIRDPALSPDGRWAAVVSEESGGQDIWIHDLTRATKTRLSFEAGADQMLPSWSPSGREIAYGTVQNSATRLMRTAVDGTGEPVVLAETEGTVLNPNWSHDGRYIVYHHQNGAAINNDISYIRLDQGTTPLESVSFISTPANERVPKLSPDGRFLAYTSDESGRLEVYIRPFPTGPGRWQASVNGGAKPQWSRDGKELFYVEQATLLSVAVSTTPEFTLGQPIALFESDDLGRQPTPAPTYDVSPDGQRFLTITPGSDANAMPPTIRVVQNWYEEFRDRQH